MDRLFYRFRHGFANGPGEWEYGDTSVAYQSWAEFVREMSEELECKYDWSELYRGVKIEKVDTPPVEWLKTQADGSKQKAAYYAAREAEFRKMIATLEEPHDAR